MAPHFESDQFGRSRRIVASWPSSVKAQSFQVPPDRIRERAVPHTAVATILRVPKGRACSLSIRFRKKAAALDLAVSMSCQRS